MSAPSCAGNPWAGRPQAAGEGCLLHAVCALLHAPGDGRRDVQSIAVERRYTAVRGSPGASGAWRARPRKKECHPVHRAPALCRTQSTPDGNARPVLDARPGRAAFACRSHRPAKPRGPDPVHFPLPCGLDPRIASVSGGFGVTCCPVHVASHEGAPRPGSPNARTPADLVPSGRRRRTTRTCSNRAPFDARRTEDHRGGVPADAARAGGERRSEGPSGSARRPRCSAPGFRGAEFSRIEVPRCSSRPLQFSKPRRGSSPAATPGSRRGLADADRRPVCRSYFMQIRPNATPVQADALSTLATLAAARNSPPPTA